MPWAWDEAIAMLCHATTTPSVHVLQQPTRPMPLSTHRCLRRWNRLANKHRRAPSAPVAQAPLIWQGCIRHQTCTRPRDPVSESVWSSAHSEILTASANLGCHIPSSSVHIPRIRPVGSAHLSDFRRHWSKRSHCCLFSRPFPYMTHWRLREAAALYHPSKVCVMERFSRNLRIPSNT